MTRKIAKRHRWTEGQHTFLERHIKGTSYLDMTLMVNEEFSLSLTIHQVKARISKLKLKNGINAQFYKGQVPSNKGKTWDEYMSKEGQKASRKTTFKKGNISYNNRSIGDERLNNDGYWYVKVKDGHGNKNWKLKHHILWEEHHGEIPEGKIVVFLDSDTNNIVIENLEMIDRGIHTRMNKNQMYTEDKDLTQTGILVNKLE